MENHASTSIKLNDSYWQNNLQQGYVNMMTYMETIHEEEGDVQFCEQCNQFNNVLRSN